VQPLRRDEVEEPPEVAWAIGVEPARLRRVEVPGDVGLDRVEAHQAGLVDAVGPLARVHPEVVQRSGDDPVRAAVEQEVVLADLERGHQAPSWRGTGRRRVTPAAGPVTDHSMVKPCCWP
jgi:hypothetical protein